MNFFNPQVNLNKYVTLSNILVYFLIFFLFLEFFGVLDFDCDQILMQTKIEIMNINYCFESLLQVYCRIFGC